MSLERQLSGGVEMYSSREGSATSGGVVQLNEMTSDSSGIGTTNGVLPYGDKPKKKIIHFADGSTMEEDDDDEDTDLPDTQQEEVKVRKVRSISEEVEGGAVGKTEVDTVESIAPVDPTSITWPTWIRHYSSRAGTKTMTVLEGMGGTAAYYLGITTPKYKSEIEEYNRMVAKKKSQDEELVSWSTGPRTQPDEPVVEDVKKSDDIPEVPETEK